MMSRLSTCLSIAGGLLALWTASVSSAQGGASCGSAAPAQLGVNAYNNASGTSTLNYAGLCDMGAFGDDSNHKAVWFRWTATETGTFRVSTCNTAGGVDTRLSVQTGCDASTVVACNDDASGCAGFSSRLTFSATAGQEYYILVGVYSATTAGGPGTFTLEAVGSGGGGSGGSTCSTAVAAVLGANSYDNSLGSDSPDYTGVCDMGPFGTDTNFNAVWFKWTATATDTFTVSTCGTAGGVDTRLSVQTSCDPFTVIACNDDGLGCADFSSQLTFEATAGTEYYIAVGVYSATTAGGPGTMNIIQGAVSGGGCGEGGDCCEESDVPGCKDPECCEQICAADPFCCTDFWDGFCVDAALAKCTACFVDCPPPAFSSEEKEPCGFDFNGGCNGGGVEFVSGIPASIKGTFWADGATRDTDWYEINITQSSTITMSVFSTLPCFAALVDPAGCTLIGSVTAGACPSSGGVCVVPGTYWVVALPAGFEGAPCGSGEVNDYVLQITTEPCDAAAPENDTCEDATVAVVGANPFDSTFAASDFADPTCGLDGAPFLKDVFFRFTAPAANSYTFQTCTGPTPFDTGIEIWTDCPKLGGVLIACNDDGPGCAAFASSVDWALAANETVFIRIGGWNGDSGATNLNISVAPPPATNDSCSDAITIGVGSTPYSTSGATTDGVTPSPCDALPFRNDLWYRFTAPSTSSYRVSLCGATGDARLEVSTGCGATAIACDDDGCGTFAGASELTFAATSGTTYTIRVGTYGATGVSAGNILIETSGGGGGGGGAGLTCANAIEFPDEGGSLPFSRAGATVDLDFTGLCDPGPVGTDTVWNAVFYRWTPAQSGNYELTTCGQANHDTRISVMTSCEVSSVIACNDDVTGCAGLTSRLFFDAECGTEYILAVGGYASTTILGTGTLGLNLQSATGTCSGGVPGDINGDGQVNGFDITALLSAWGPCPGSCPADINGDGQVNGIDLTVILSGWTG